MRSPARHQVVTSCLRSENYAHLDHPTRRKTAPLSIFGATALLNCKASVLAAEEESAYLGTCLFDVLPERSTKVSGLWLHVPINLSLIVQIADWSPELKQLVGMCGRGQYGTTV